MKWEETNIMKSKMTGSGVAALGLLLATTFGGLGTTAALAQDWEPEFDGAVLLPLPDGFPSMPISIVAAGDAKSVAGRLAHQLANYSSLFRNKSILVNAVFKPELETLGNWEALKYAAGAEGGNDGHVVVVFASPDDILDLHVNSDAKDLGVGLDDLSEVLSIEDHRYAVVQCKEAGWDPTWEGLMQQIKDNPGEVSYAGGDPGDRLDMTFAHYMKDQGIGNLYDKGSINHANAGDVGARTAAVAACEADVTVSDLDQLITKKMGKQVDVLLISGDKRVRKYKEAPASSEVGIADDPMSRTMQIVVPAGVDPLHIKWLGVLLGKTSDDSYFKAGRILDQVMNSSNILDEEESAALNDSTNATLDALTQDLGININ